MSSPVVHLHAESMRMGIRLAAYVYTGQHQPPDRIRQILETRPPNCVLHDFPLETIHAVVRDRQDRRRLTAVRAMEVMLHHSGDSTLLTQEHLEKIATRAWQLASAMEEQENVSASMDSLQNKQAGG